MYITQSHTDSSLGDAQLSGQLLSISIELELVGGIEDIHKSLE